MEICVVAPDSRVDGRGLLTDAIVAEETTALLSLTLVQKVRKGTDASSRDTVYQGSTILNYPQHPR
jgi:hypothetical protein